MSKLPTTFSRLASRAFSLAEKEVSVLKELHADVQATLSRMTEADPGLKDFLTQSYGCAVFPSIGKATAIVGGAFGKGEVICQGELIGYAAVAQLTIGVQLGGQTFSQIVVFENKQGLDRFKAGRYAFAANASAVLVKAGAAISNNYEKGVAVLVHSEGGMMLEAAVGGQKFFFRPAVLGRGKSAESGMSTARKAADTSGVRQSRRTKRKTARKTPASRPARTGAARTTKKKAQRTAKTASKRR